VAAGDGSARVGSVESVAQRAGRSVATIVGWLLGAVFFAVGKARTRRRKALHPRGEVRSGRVDRHGCARRTGVEWIDEPGTDQVLVRLSRSTGVPPPLPDVYGMALRLPRQDGGYGDLLLATTGTGVPGRFVLRLARHAASAYTSLFPYRAPCGAVLLAALPLDAEGARFELAWSGLSGPWAPFAVLEVPSESDAASDGRISFDPVLNLVPGLDSYRWAAQLRRFAYAGSRRARGTVSAGPGSHRA
jgi:hypothetical protein